VLLLASSLRGAAAVGEHIAGDHQQPRQRLGGRRGIEAAPGDGERLRHHLLSGVGVGTALGVTQYRSVICAKQSLEALGRRIANMRHTLFMSR
jgi:hypothetical protein